MSTLDISRITLSLASTKVKERSDSLSLLETLVSSKFSLTSKHLKLLIKSLFDFIHVESTLYKGNPLPATEARLSRASQSLKLILDKTGSIQLRYKTLLSIVTSIIDHFFVGNEILEPCAKDFAQIIANVLDVDYFVEHLTVDEWNDICTFLKKVMNSLMTPWNHKNNSLLSTLFEALQNLYQCSTSTNSLHAYANYRDLHRLFDCASKLFKSDHFVIVSILRFINKLSIVLSTQDGSFVKKLIELGLQILNNNVHTTWDSIQTQMLTFLNLAATHNLEYYQEDLAGPNANKNHEVPDSQVSKSHVASNNSWVDEIYLHLIKSLILRLVAKLNTGDYKFEPNDIGIVHNDNRERTWFKLNTVYLKSENHKPWLLAFGTSRLINTYLKLKNTGSRSSLVDESFMSDSFETPRKKLKTEGFEGALQEATNSLDFYCRLSKKHLRQTERQAYLQLLTFFLEGNHVITSSEEPSLVGLFRSTATSFEEDHKFWALHCLKANVFFQTKMEGLHSQVLKLSLQNLNDSASCSISCNLIYTIMLLSPSQYNAEEVSILTQLDNLIDLPMANGPVYLNDEAIQFWIAVYKFMLITDYQKRSLLAKRIEVWLINKLESSSLDAENFFVTCTKFPLFIGWLCGGSIQYQTPSIPIFPYEGEIVEYCILEKSFFELERFILLQPHSLPSPECRTFSIDHLLTQNLSATFEAITHYCESLTQSYQQFQWAIICRELGSVFNGIHTMHSYGSRLNLVSDELLESIQFSESEKWKATRLASSLEWNAGLFDPENFLLYENRATQVQSRGSSVTPIEQSADNSGMDMSEDFFGDEFNRVKLKSDDDKKPPKTLSLISSNFVWIPSIGSTKVLIDYSQSRELTFASVLSSFSICFETLNPTDYLKTLYYLVQEIERLDIQASDIKSHLASMTRMIGERVLSRHELERNELSVVVVAKLLRLSTSIVFESSDEGFRKDYDDLSLWMIECGELNLIYTQFSVTEYCKWMLFFMIKNDEINVSNIRIKKIVFNYLNKSINIIKACLSMSVSDWLVSIPITKQTIEYHAMIACFPNPEETKESAATYSLFFSIISTSSTAIFVTSLFNQLKLSKYGHFGYYLRISLETFATRLKLSSVKDLFHHFKLEILRFWWKFDNLTAFPWSVFDFGDETSFFNTNYREIIAVSMTTKGKMFSLERGSDAHTVFSMISRARSSTVSELIAQSVPTIIALAYSKDGTRNEIFEVLANHNVNYKAELTFQLHITLLEIIKHTDISNDTLMRDFFDPQEPLIAYSFILPRNDRTSISFNSSLDLVQKLVQKYSKERKVFWNVEIVYFLFRRLSLGFRDILRIEEKINLLRRLKLVILLGGPEVKADFFTANIVIKSLCLVLSKNPPLENSSEMVSFFQHDVLMMLENFSVLVFEKFNEKYLLLFIHLMNALLQIPKSMIPKVLIECLKQFILQIDPKRTIYPLLVTSSEILSSKPVHTPPWSIERFLADSKELDTCTNGDLNDILSLISLIFAAEESNTVVEHNEHVVKILLKSIEANPHSSREFELWSAKYLARYYLNGGFVEGVKEFLEAKESCDFNVSELLTNLTSFNSLFALVKTYLSDTDPEVCACAESVVGAFINWYDTDYDQSMAELGSPFLECREFLLPITHQSCASIYDEQTFDYKNDIHYLVNNLYTAVNEGVDKFSLQVFLSILKEITKDKGSAPIIAIFASKVQSFARSNLPFLLCYYANTKHDALEIVIKIMVQLQQMELKVEMIRLFIDTLIMMRMFYRKGISNFELIYRELDLEICYTFASSINFHHTALMIVEDQMNGRNIDNVISNPNLTSSTIIKTIYQSIDDDDLVFGLPVETSIEYAFKQITHNSADLLTFNSSMLDSQIALNHKQTFSAPVLDSMLANGYLGLSKIMNQEDSHKYEGAWKLNCWELPAPRKPRNEHEAIYKTLKTLREGISYSKAVCEEVMLGALSIGDVLCSNRSQKEVYSSILERIRTIATVENMKDVIEKSSIVSSSLQSINPLGFAAFNSGDQVQNSFTHIEKFNHHTRWFETCDTGLSESIIVARQATFQILMNGQSRRDIASWLPVLNELSRLNHIARFNGKTQKIMSSTIMLSNIVKSEISLVGPMARQVLNLSKYHEACSLWAQGQTGIPVLMLQEIKNDGGVVLPIEQLNVSVSVINAKLVEWMSESRQDLASNIMTKYVLPTYEWMRTNSTNDSSQHITRSDPKVYESLAHFCEVQYKSRGLNEELSKLEKRVANKSQEIEELKSHYSKTSVPAKEKKAVQKFYAKLKHQLQSETNELERIRSSKNQFSSKAVEFYLRSVSLGGSEESLDKFFSLWLENPNRDLLNATIEDFILKLPSYKLISWCTQLISRLSNDCTPFQRLLHRILLQLCVDHPHHTLYQLMSLRKHDSSADNVTSGVIVSKFMAANKLWDELKQECSSYQSQLAMVEEFCTESVKLAEHKIPKGRVLNLDRATIGKYWIEQLPGLPPPTKYLPVDQTTMYKNVPRLHKIENRVTIATSGLSLPKIARFILTDGSVHKILFKHGTDDLRQDSIMEQVFEKVNHIFQKDKETRRRKLSIRTYKAVPIGPQAGMIEFVPSSIALIDVVKPYHAKYDSLSLDKARIRMKECQSDDKAERVKVYRQIADQVHPALRYFFFENFVTPDDWFNSKISYNHGMATTSMVGHILGLGDRHCNNILLDKSTGEPIHIDLGVAFDQGKRLPIPETVPFRLTRDLVDGLGVTGVEGSFRRCCELTFKVLRANKEHVISILDVLRWDPLYSWALSPIKKKKLQDEETGWVVQPEEDGSEAGRAVSTVMDKLTAGGLSDEAVVRELIQEATSAENLALIYFGWCPFF